MSERKQLFFSGWLPLVCLSVCPPPPRCQQNAKNVNVSPHKVDVISIYILFIRQLLYVCVFPPISIPANYIFLLLIHVNCAHLPFSQHSHTAPSIYEVSNINKEISPTWCWSLISPALLRIIRQNIILQELQQILARVKVQLVSTTCLWNAYEVGARKIFSTEFS